MQHKPTSGVDASRKPVSNFLFGLFIYFTIDFFLHFSARIPFYGALRPSILLTLAITVLLFSQGEKFKGYTKDPEVRTIIILIAYIIVTLPFVSWPGSVLRNNIPEFVKAVSFFFFAAYILDSDKRFRIYMTVFISCQVFRVLEPLYLHIAYGYWGDFTFVGHSGFAISSGSEFAGRLSGAPSDVVNANGLGFVIATLVPYIYYLLWCGPSKKGKLLFLILIPLLVYALVLTLSRGALVSLCVIGWIIFKQSRHKFVLIVVTVICAVVTWSHMTPLQKERYLSLVDSDTSQSATASGRISGMEEEFMLGLHRPIFGHGVGTTPEAKFHIIGKARASHNLYAELMIEIGLVGMFIFLRYMWTIYQSVKANNKFMMSDKESNQLAFHYRLNQAMVAVFWMYAVYSMAYWGLSVYYWYLFGGLAFAARRIYFRKDADVPTATMQPRQAI